MKLHYLKYSLQPNSFISGKVGLSDLRFVVHRRMQTETKHPVKLNYMLLTLSLFAFTNMTYGHFFRTY